MLIEYQPMEEIATKEAIYWMAKNEHKTICKIKRKFRKIIDQRNDEEHEFFVTETRLFSFLAWPRIIKVTYCAGHHIINQNPLL